MERNTNLTSWPTMLSRLRAVQNLEIYTIVRDSSTSATEARVWEKTDAESCMYLALVGTRRRNELFEKKNRFRRPRILGYLGR